MCSLHIDPPNLKAMKKSVFLRLASLLFEQNFDRFETKEYANYRASFYYSPITNKLYPLFNFKTNLSLS